MRTSQLQQPVANTRALSVGLQCVLAAVLLFTAVSAPVLAQQETASASSQLTPLQLEIERQRPRLDSSDDEERRDAVMRLGAMKRPEASRVAAIALRDSSAIIRATTARAVLSLPPDEAAGQLAPLLQDRNEFVRQEVAYALGETKSRSAARALIAMLEKEEKDGVRGAAVVALGQIGDEAAVIVLAQLLDRRVPASGIINRLRRSKKDENEFVRRAAARSLGQIGNRAAVPALAAVVTDEKAPDDVRREAVSSLALIGDVSAVPALRATLTARDPYLARSAWDALRKIAPDERNRPTGMN